MMKKLHRPKVLPRGSLEGRPVGTARPISCRYRSDVNRPGRLTTPTPSCPEKELREACVLPAGAARAPHAQALHARAPTASPQG